MTPASIPWNAPTRPRSQPLVSDPIEPPLGLGSASAPWSRDDAPAPPGTVLLLVPSGVDTNGVNEVLAPGGFTVVTAAPDDGGAIKRALDEPPGVIVADLEPNEDLAFRVLRRLGDALGGFVPPLIVLSSRTDETWLRWAFEQGAHDVLAKPVAPGLLRVKVRQHRRPAPGGRRRVGPYAVKKVIGRGGMGTVYLAERDGIEVALKVLDAATLEGRPETLARFRRETEALRRLRHRNLPRLLDAGRAGDAFYCAMELVRGRSLDVLSRNRPFGERATRHVLVEAAAALEAVHAAGLVHRDVKPTNILVHADGSRRVRLVDFGLCKEMDDHGLTHHDEILGTAPYMAPEVVRGRPQDARSDAFALGLTALEVALGRAPFQGRASEILEERALGFVPRAAELLRDASPALVSAIDGLLRSEADLRLPLRDIPRLLEH